ncbi:hypothetical protein X772_15135 [Mesorhizobium sp. LSJC280B00]|nr:hypothetical protein X772_15135 [Mesorhizobium sp. LSJC280B00]
MLFGVVQVKEPKEAEGEAGDSSAIVEGSGA